MHSNGPLQTSVDISHRKRWGVYYYFNTQFLHNFGVLCCHWKQSFIPFRAMFQCFNVASIGPATSFRSFDVSHRRRWEGDTIILTPNSCSILVFFVATEIYILYLSGPCFNVQMWPVLVLQFHFEVLMFQQEEMERVYHYFNIQFLLNFSVLCCYWKR